MTFRVEQIDHVELYVPDRYRAADWYHNVLGLEIVTDLEHWARDPSGPLMIATSSGQTNLALFQGPARGSQDGYGFHLVAFKTNATSFMTFLTRLATLDLRDNKGRPVQPELVRDHGSAISIYFNDPYGNHLELTTYEHERCRKLLAVKNELTIREATSADEALIGEVVRLAFESSAHGHHGEANLHSTAQQSGIPRLSLVACLNQQVVGHILFTAATLRNATRTFHGMGLAPVAVHPEYQNCGIGTALIRTGLQQLWTQNCLFAIVIGAPDYYSRCGFVPAKTFDIQHGFEGIPQEFFLIVFQQNMDHSDAQGMRAYYADFFGPQHA